MISETKVVNKRTHIKTDNDVYIGRGSIWGNPFPINEHQSREKVCSLYKEYLNCRVDLLKSLYKLKDKNLVCYCDPLECHGHYLKQVVDTGLFDIIVPDDAIVKGYVLKQDDPKYYNKDEYFVEFINGNYIDFGYYFGIDLFVIKVYNKKHKLLSNELYNVNDFHLAVCGIQTLVKQFS